MMLFHMEVGHQEERTQGKGHLRGGLANYLIFKIIFVILFSYNFIYILRTSLSSKTSACIIYMLDCLFLVFSFL